LERFVGIFLRFVFLLINVIQLILNNVLFFNIGHGLISFLLQQSRNIGHSSMNSISSTLLPFVTTYLISSYTWEN
jgi:hypothetical protein